MSRQPSGAPLLKVDHVTVRFGGLTAVDDVTFEVHEGDLLGLIGPNGAGKTTLMRSIIGVVQPTEGSVSLGGEALNGLPIHKRIQRGMSLSQQLVKPLRDISMGDNVALAAASAKTVSPLRALLNVSNEQELAVAQHELQRVGIASMASQSPSIQPLGVLKRLELARALATQPKLLLLDEVLAGLNPQEIQDMLPVVRGLVDTGVTVLMIEHVMQAVMSLAEHVWVLAQGQLIAQGSPSEVTRDTQVIEAYLGHGAATRLRQAEVSA
mgnify:CR=1 FL=1